VDGDEGEMPKLPYDWTRNEEEAKVIVEDKLKKKTTEKKIWEKKAIKLLLILWLVGLIIYAVWEFVIK